MFYDGIGDPVRILAVGAAAYAALLLVLRVSGKRTLATMNAFDLVVTVALGSTLATILLDRQVSFVDGVAALVLLVVLQFIVTWSVVRSRRVRRLVKSAPTLVLRDGVPLPDALRRHRITTGELHQAVRAHGLGDLDAVAAVVLETDGSFSLITRDRAGSGSALTSVDRWAARGRDVVAD
jgi:uncharacterized membrane protein YcaP (DUF421 family)